MKYYIEDWSILCKITGNHKYMLIRKQNENKDIKCARCNKKKSEIEN